jgi:hypothetical protein
MSLLLAGAGIWLALIACFCCMLAAASRADRALERPRPAPRPRPEAGPRLRLIAGGAQDSAASSGNRTALAGRSSRRPL